MTSNDYKILNEFQLIYLVASGNYLLFKKSKYKSMTSFLKHQFKIIIDLQGFVYGPIFGKVHIYDYLANCERVG